MRYVYYICFLLLSTSLSANNNTFTIGGGTGQLLIRMFHDGGFLVERESFPGSSVWQIQFFSNTELFAVKVGPTSYGSCQCVSIGNDVVNITGTRGEYSKTYSFIHRVSGDNNSRFPFSVTIKTIYDTSNPDYFVLDATINADLITTGEPISLAFAYDSYVNDCDGGVAWILPDLAGYNGVDAMLNLTAAEIGRLQFVGAANNQGSGSFMGFFPIGRYFDRAYSAHYSKSYASTIVKSTYDNLFKFGPQAIPTCSSQSPWDNGVGVAYDNIPSGTTSSITTGLTFTANMDGVLDYTWDNLKNKTTSIGGSNTLNLSYTSLNPSLLTDIAFRTDFFGLEIGSSCTATSLLSGISDCSIGNDYYKLSNASVWGGGTTRIDIPIIVKQYGEWTIGANSISETEKTLPTGAVAKLTAPTNVNISAVSADSICSGDSFTVTVELDGTATTSQDIVVDISYVGSTVELSNFTSLPSTITISANTRVVTFTVISSNTIKNDSKLNFTLSATNKSFALIGGKPSGSVVCKAKPILSTPFLSAVCTNSLFTYVSAATDAKTNFSWTRAIVPGISNGAASGNNGNINEMLANTTNAPIDVNYAITLKLKACSVVENLTVTVKPVPYVHIFDTVVCNGGTPTLTVSDIVLGATYNWYSGSNLIHTGFSFTTPVLSSTTNYRIEATNGHCSDFKTVNVEVISPNISTPKFLPRYQMWENYNFMLRSDALLPVFSVESGSLPPGLILNSNGALQGIVTADGKYEFSIKVTDIYGCTLSKQFNIVKELFIPEIFTPNGDGINDHFMKGYKVIIFDRLGLKLYEGDDGWDGTYNNKLMNPDSYFYVLFDTNNDVKEFRFGGCIVLIRH